VAVGLVGVPDGSIKLLKIIVDAPLCRRVNGESWMQNIHVIKMSSYCQKQAYSNEHVKRI